MKARMDRQTTPPSAEGDTESRADNTVDGIARRRALARLGLATALAYATPTLLRIDRSANARVVPSPCVPPGSGLPGRPCGGEDEESEGGWGEEEEGGWGGEEEEGGWGGGESEESEGGGWRRRRRGGRGGGRGGEE